MWHSMKQMLNLVLNSALILEICIVQSVQQSHISWCFRTPAALSVTGDIEMGVCTIPAVVAIMVLSLQSMVFG